MAEKSVKPTKTKTRKPRKTTSPQTEAQVVQAEPKVYKTSIRPTTWIAVVAFIAIIALAVYLNRKTQSDLLAQPTLAVAEKSFVFPKDAVISSIEIKSLKGDAVKIERGTDKAWVLILPEKAAADQAACEAAASQAAALSIDLSIDAVNNLSDFGLNHPAYTISVSFKNGETSVLIVGDASPSATGYYAQLDKGSVNVVSKSGIDALLSLLTAPPYSNPPTPIPSS